MFGTVLRGKASRHLRESLGRTVMCVDGEILSPRALAKHRKKSKLDPAARRS
jgi:hypothetical protein